MSDQSLSVRKSEVSEVMPHIEFDWKNKTVRLLNGCPFEEAQIGVDFLCEIHDDTPMMIGDLLNAMEVEYGEKYAQAMEATGKKYDTVLHYCNVAAKIPFQDRRMDKLLFTHHRVVAYLEPDKRKKYLDMAADGGWSVEEMKRRIWKDLDVIPEFTCNCCHKKFRDYKKDEVQAYRVCGKCNNKIKKIPEAK